MDMIRSIHDASHQNYGAPKITAIMKKAGEKISEKTVGNYMKEMGIHAQYIKPYTQTWYYVKSWYKLKWDYFLVTEYTFCFSPLSEPVILNS